MRTPRCSSRLVVRGLAPFAAVALAGCVDDATEVRVRVDTDLTSRPLELRVIVRHQHATLDAGGDALREWTVDGADAASARLPASFGIVPGPGEPLDEVVSFVVELRTLAPSDAPVALRRYVDIALRAHATQLVDVFLATRCAAADERCPGASSCTTEELCESLGATCDETGRCVSRTIGDAGATPIAVDATAARDVAVDAGTDAVETDADASACAAGRTLCATTCADLATDPVHCGGCANACPARATCAAGVCVCAHGLSRCGAACTDEGTDTRNCGACGRVCTVTGSQCCNGTCIDSAANNSACGSCTRVCTGGTRCCGGQCNC